MKENKMSKQFFFVVFCYCFSMCFVFTVLQTKVRVLTSDFLFLGIKFKYQNICQRGGITRNELRFSWLRDYNNDILWYFRLSSFYLYNFCRDLFLFYLSRRFFGKIWVDLYSYYKILYTYSIFGRMHMKTIIFLNIIKNKNIFKCHFSLFL